MKSVENAQVHAISELHSCRDIIASQKKILFERFLEFKQRSQNASAHRVAGARNGSSDAPSLLITLEPPYGSSQAVLEHSEPTTLSFEFGQQARQSKTCSLPFADSEFDWVFCDAVIEHIGPLERQYLLLKELCRISRKGVFATTVNRWHPLEFYTGLPLIHWLPEAWWRRVLKWLGRTHSSPESRLNLIGSKELKKLASLLPRSPSFSIGHIRFLGIKATFFLQIRKMP